MTTSAFQQIPTRTFGIGAAAIETVLRALAAGYRRQASRRQLQSLTLEQLRDVGIDPDLISRGHEIPGDPWLMSRLMSLR